MPRLLLLSARGGGSTTNTSNRIVNNTQQSTGTVQITGTVQPDPSDPTSTGTNSGATVPVIGQEDPAVQTDGNGNFNLNVQPQLSGTVPGGPSLNGRSRMAPDTKIINYGSILVFPHLVNRQVHLNARKRRCRNHTATPFHFHDERDYGPIPLQTP